MDAVAHLVSFSRDRRNGTGKTPRSAASAYTAVVTLTRNAAARAQLIRARAGLA
jgi:hypothetical protein